jgi:peroxiredoxin family protein
MDESTFSLVLFSGTDDKLDAAAVLMAGAAAMGRKVNVFLQYWALDAFRTDRITKDHGVAPEAGPDGAELLQRHGGQHWSEILRQAKSIGDVKIHACSLYAGAGPAMMKHLGKQHGVASPNELLEIARELGVRLVPCQMTMDLLGLQPEDMIDGLEEPAGATSMLLEAQDAVTLFI